MITIKGIDGNPLSCGIINHLDVDGKSGLVSNLRIFETGINCVVTFSFDFSGGDNLLDVNGFGSNPPGSPETGSVTLYNFEGNENTVSHDDNAIIGQTTVYWIRYNSGCAFTTNIGSSLISSLSVNNSTITLINGVAAELNNPIDFSFSFGGKYLYALSTCRTSGGQTSINVYDVINNCGLNQIQVISDGLPSE